MGGENLDALKTAATDPATVLSFLSQVAPKYRRYDAWGRPIDVSINQGLAGAAQAFAGARTQNLQAQMLNDITNQMTVPRTTPAQITSDIEQPNEYTGEGWKQYAEGLGQPGLAPKEGKGGVNAQGMPVLPKPAYQQQIKDIEKYRPPMLAEFLKGKTPQQVQALMAGGASGLFGAVKPPMLQRFEEMRSESNNEIARQKTQLLGEASIAAQKNPENTDAVTAMMTLANDIGRDPFALRKNAVERGALINYLTTNGVKVDEGGTARKYTPEEAAQLADTGTAHTAIAATQQHNEQVRKNLDLLKAYEASNPPPELSDQARKVAMAGGDMSYYLKTGQEGLQRALFARKYGPILDAISMGKPLSGTDPSGKPYNSIYSEADIGEMFQDIQAHDPAFAQYLTTKVESNLNNRLKNDLQTVNIKSMDTQRRMLEEQRDDAAAMRWGNQMIAVQKLRDGTPPIDKQNDPAKVKAYYAGLDDQISTLKQNYENTLARNRIKWGHGDAQVMMDRDQYDQAIERLQKNPNPSLRIQGATQLMQDLHRNYNWYGKDHPAWVQFYKNEQDKLIGPDGLMHQSKATDTIADETTTPRAHPHGGPTSRDIVDYVGSHIKPPEQAQTPGEYTGGSEDVPLPGQTAPTLSPSTAAPSVTPPGSREEFNFPDRLSPERAQLDAASPGGDFNALPQAQKSLIFRKVIGGRTIFQPTIAPQ